MSTVTAGRSFRQGEVTRAELLKVTSQFKVGRGFFAPDMDGWHYDVRLVEGDLSVPGGLDLFAQGLAALVVTGNLEVQGAYGDGDDPWSGVFVLGDMRAANVVTAGSLSVAGSLTVAGGIVGDYNDYSATVGGQTTARYLHTEYHWFDFGAAVQVEYVLGSPRGSWPKTTRLRELPAARYPDVLVSEVFSPDPAELTDEERAKGWFDLDHREVSRRTSVGEPVLLDWA
ncbi:hypothetical protein RB614_43160 [Phytohabitans sp. ZYX-F-186]|uniref:Uncharacterized protein n=1 Tax=Phytohabitans maris TaxID=3071409 RepID=A0ABU0ZW96_9ACTN|nr:hypothetical protein [Phytohabitans sp. ZYX-F-186]MDQ7911310.1 hypothetical protein [Phytohabitans sp. ZYX-F-186]